MFFQGEQVGSYRRFGERLTVALLQWSPAGRKAPPYRVTLVHRGGNYRGVARC